VTEVRGLTKRYGQVLTLMAEGRSNAGIATALVLTLGTVKSTSPASSPS
jgi:DNA-binding NarL/FixJ family response regulator